VKASSSPATGSYPTQPDPADVDGAADALTFTPDQTTATSLKGSIS
jgi:hypothetical protein